MTSLPHPQACFLKDACETMARNAGDLLGLASRHITVGDLIGIVRSLPRCPRDLLNEEWRKGMLSRALEAALSRDLTGSEKQRRDQLFEYFLRDIPSRPYYELDLLQAAFVGVLGGIDWSEAVRERIVVVSAAPKPQERWWWREYQAAKTLD